MGYLLFRALASGAIIAIVSKVAKRSSGVGALIVSLPLVLWEPSGASMTISLYFLMIVRASLMHWCGLLHGLVIQVRSLVPVRSVGRMEK